MRGFDCCFLSSRAGFIVRIVVVVVAAGVVDAEVAGVDERVDVGVAGRERLVGDRASKQSSAAFRLLGWVVISLASVVSLTLPGIVTVELRSEMYGVVSQREQSSTSTSCGGGVCCRPKILSRFRNGRMWSRRVRNRGRLASLDIMLRVTKRHPCFVGD